ncbi:MAG: S8 family serine peptidase [Euryarchaeota archaeon]|nr:S8 family serine peptidase [Euryarchaeota archaeon]
MAGSTYLGYEVLSVNFAVQFVVLEVTDPVAFSVRAFEDPNVRYHHYDEMAFEAYFTPSEQYFDCCQWGIKDVGAQTAWDTTLGSTSIKLAVLDTGLRKSHEDIGNYLQGWDFIDGDNTPQDGNGHGTHVASTAAGLTNNGKGVAGVAQVTILPVRVLNNAGSGSFSQISNGITWAADQGADIISMSLGASSGTTELKNAVDYAHNSGALVISASGNDNGPIGYPAKYANSMAVGAYDKNRDKASFSNYGAELDISAPGVEIAAAYNRNNADYVYLDGTSMATPIVSGTAGLGLSVNPTLTNTELRSLLTSTANDLGSAGWDQFFGYGGVNAAAVVANAGSGGGGGGGQTTVYSEDFEGSTSFTKSSGSGDLWRLSSGCLGGNGGRSLQFNQADCDYSTGSRATGWAQTAVDLSGASSAALSFDHKWETESYSGGAYDIMRVQVASCTSCTWTTLEQWDSRNANQLSWGAESYDLSGWTGDSSVYVRFWFDSVDSTANAYDGWGVDNFHVTKG